MNVKKSIQIAMAQRGMKQKDLAEALGVGDTTVSGFMNRENCSSQTIQRLAEVFQMKESEFIALGED